MSFTGPASYPTDAGPRDVVAGHFTRNGLLDLATANYSANSVSVLLGDHHGGFRAAHNYPVDAGPIAIAAGDLTGNGLTDLVTLNIGSSPYFIGTVSVLLSNGDGTFQPAQTFAVRQTGEASNALALADINGDGKLDLIVGNSYPNDAVSVWLGNGDGSFRAPIKTILPVQGQQINSVAVGDFNGDGKPDLVAVTGSSPFSATVLLGNGDGSFQVGPSFSLGTSGSTDSHGVVVGDFNGDGKLDFAVGGDDIWVFLGNGDGTFAPPTGYHVTYFGDGGLQVADLNGDGVPDLITTSSYYQVSVLLGNGDGTFQAPVTLAPGGSSALALGDFTGDGQTDLALPSGGNQVSVFPGNGDGTFQTGAPVGLPAGDFILGAVDLNGDGIPDLIAGNGNMFSGRLDILLGNGDGSFQSPISYNLPFSPTSAQAADFNGDGIPDIVVTGPGVRSSGRMVAVLLGNGDGTFGNPTEYTTVDMGPRFVTVADLNGDGIPDLVVTTPLQAPLYGNTISVLLGNGDGTFQAATSYTVGIDPTGIAVGDANGDGIPDLIVSYAGSAVGMVPGGVDLLLGNGNGTFQNASMIINGFKASAVVAADFANDSSLDLAVADATNSQIRIYRGNGDGTFQDAHDYAVGLNPTALALADFNQDGRLDLAVAGSFGARVLSGKPDGTFRSQRVSYGPAATFVAAADFNADGLPDLLTDTGIFINRGGGHSGRAGPLPGVGVGLPATDRLFQPDASDTPIPVVPASTRSASSAWLDPASVAGYFAALRSWNPENARPSAERQIPTMPSAYGSDGRDLEEMLDRDLFGVLAGY